MKIKQMLLAATMVLLAGRSWAAMGTAKITGTQAASDIHGTLNLEDTAMGLKITGTIENLPKGEKAFHIHEYGDCGDEGKNAGGHFNPDQHQHGNVTKDGIEKAHPGDMGNLMVNDRGMGIVNVTLKDSTLTTGKYAVAGRAFIIHAMKDDFSQPTGNAGGRIACGPILISK